MSNRLLVGDIGGTNVRFAIAHQGDLAGIWHARVSDFHAFEDALDAYLNSGSHVEAPLGQSISRAVLAIAAPVKGDEIKLTNNGWTISRTRLEAKCGFKVDLMNDFAAIARSIPYLTTRIGEDHHSSSAEDYCAIGTALPAEGNIAIIGPGTGLGVASLIKTPAGWIDLAGEGGHVTMPPRTKEEQEIISIVGRELSHVSAERLLSGEGLVRLYRACCSRNGSQPLWTTPQQITSGMSGESSDPQRLLCAEVFEFFCSMLGTVAGNLALTCGSLGGVYLTGGILRRFPYQLQSSRFRERFQDKGRLEGYLSAIPSYLVLREDPALLGLANWPDKESFAKF